MIICKPERFIEVVSTGVALVFLYAAFSKLLDYSAFELQLEKSPVLSPFSFWAGPLTIIAELGSAGLLCFSKTRLPGLYISLGLMAVFAAYIFTVSHLAAQIPCSCGGILGKMSWEKHFIFNMVMVCLIVIAIVLFTSRPTPGTSRVLMLYCNNPPGPCVELKRRSRKP